MHPKALFSLPLLLLVACGAGSSDSDTGNSTAQAEFQLPDVNATSPSYRTDVSPRDFLGGVSAWYFGSAT
ncbi:MAG: hypothetical protein ACYTGZ_04855 [Planctomycetota bacterium]|jgi:hypothetical protein